MSKTNKTPTQDSDPCLDDIFQMMMNQISYFLYKIMFKSEIHIDLL